MQVALLARAAAEPVSWEQFLYCWLRAYLLLPLGHHLNQTRCRFNKKVDKLGADYPTRLFRSTVTRTMQLLWPGIRMFSMFWFLFRGLGNRMDFAGTIARIYLRCVATTFGLILISTHSVKSPFVVTPASYATKHETILIVVRLFVKRLAGQFKMIPNSASKDCTKWVVCCPKYH